MKTKLSESFYLSEFTKSDVAATHGIKNIPPDEAVENLIALCTRVLQPVRNALNEPLFISSGYRSPELNKAVGGVVTSQHLTGEAADIYCKGMSAGDLFSLILSLGIEFDQLILYSTFVHVSFSEGNNRMQAFVK
jgi:uncharacterized protein YcbK (DUF882 family)